jgi:phosphoglycolate phosphatase
MSGRVAGEIRAVVFDLDGTLVDAFGDIAAAVNFGLREMDLPEHSVETIKGFVGNGVPKLAERALGEAATPERGRLLVDLLVTYYRQHPVDFAQPYPGCVGVLKTLRRHGIRIGVLSNKRHELTWLVLERLGLLPHLDQVQGEGGVERKPDPAGYLELVKRVGVRVEESIMVGDGQPDADVARRVGVPFVGVSYGILSAERLRELGAVTILDDLEELLSWLGLQDESHE